MWLNDPVPVEVVQPHTPLPRLEKAGLKLNSMPRTIKNRTSKEGFYYLGAGHEIRPSMYMEIKMVNSTSTQFWIPDYEISNPF